MIVSAPAIGIIVPLMVISLVLIFHIAQGLNAMSAATDRLTASTDALAAAVTAATNEIAALKSGNDDAVLNAASDKIDAATAALTAASVA